MMVISFYSYKGGTGRTTMLANVAYQLALLKKKVLCLDFDIDGPGLLHVLKLPTNVVETQNIIELLSYDRQEGDAVPKMNIADHILLRKWTIPSDVEIDCIAAPVGTERQRIVEYYSGEELGARVKRVCSQAEAAGYDFLLIDSSAGFDTFTALAFAAADLALVCFRWSEQHIQGTLEASYLLGEMLKRNYRAINSGKAREFPLKDFWLMASGVPEAKTTYHKQRQEMVESVLSKRIGEIKQQAGLPADHIDIIRVSEDDDLKWEEQVVVAGMGRPVFDQFTTVARKLMAFADRFGNIESHSFMAET